MSRSREHQPVRTCVGCRQHEAKAELLRVVVAGPRVIPDFGQRLPGRGAYLHRNEECARRAIPRGLARALRTEVRPSSAESLRRAAGRATNRPEFATRRDDDDR